jgi:hypothetical protein
MAAAFSKRALRATFTAATMYGAEVRMCLPRIKSDVRAN